jgi:hypothetical protein
MVLQGDCVNRDTENRACKGNNERHQSHSNSNGPSFSPGPVLRVSNIISAIKLDKVGFLLRLADTGGWRLGVMGSFLDVGIKILSRTVGDVIRTS